MRRVRKEASRGAWQDPSSISDAAPAPSQSTIDATVAYCSYVYERYGRFPAYQPPLRTLLGFQANHVDTDFYDRFYQPEALTDLQREHMERWH